MLPFVAIGCSSCIACYIWETYPKFCVLALDGCNTFNSYSCSSSKTPSSWLKSSPPLQKRGTVHFHQKVCNGLSHPFESMLRNAGTENWGQCKSQKGGGEVRRSKGHWLVSLKLLHDCVSCRRSDLNTEAAVSVFFPDPPGIHFYPGIICFIFLPLIAAESSSASSW